MPRVVIVGCGSSLRTDDRFGRDIAGRLAKRVGNDPEIKVISTEQLLPEHVTLIRDARLVLVIDAADTTPGAIHFGPVKLPSRKTRPSLTHAFTPADLARVAGELYARPVRVYTLTAGAYSFAVGETMTPSMSALADRVVAEIAVRLRRSRPAGPDADTG